MTRKQFFLNNYHQTSGISSANKPGYDRSCGCPSVRDQRANPLPLAKRIWGLDKTQAKKLKELERENLQLKKLVADLSLDNAILKEVLSKK